MQALLVDLMILPLPVLPGFINTGWPGIAGSSCLNFCKGAICLSSH
jgi:hypothetical protein